MAVDPYNRYLNKAERDKEDIYKDFRLKKPFALLVYKKIFQRVKGLLLFVNPLSAGYAFKRIHSVFPQLKFDRN